MSEGQEGDIRQFGSRLPKSDVDKSKIDVFKSPSRVCDACKQVIVGKKFRVGENKFLCNRCNSE